MLTRHLTGLLLANQVGDAKVLVHASPEVVTVVHPRGSGGMTAALQFAEGLASVRWS